MALRRSLLPRTLATLASLVALAACVSGGPSDDIEAGEAAFTGTPNADIGQFFVIEHFGIEAAGFVDVHAMIKQKNIGALILWNPDHASGETTRRMIKAYTATAQANGRPDLFIGADQEEKSIQRFRERHGFTGLVDGATLGRVVARDNSPRVCELHARITSRELASVGMNMTFGTVSDIFTRDSGTRGMFRTRAIDSNPEIVTSCIKAMTKAYGAEGHVVFVTKHFPGLGNATGNTDVDPRVHSFSNLKEEMETELAPYRAATASVNADDTWPMFGAMVSHASYEIIDASKSPATLSSVILHDFLRAPSTAELPLGGATFKGMDLKGLTVSDAFWTWGATRDITPIAKRRLMARSFLAGMDILMIAKTDFAGAWDYFQSIFAGQLTPGEQATLVAEAHERDFPTLQAKFKARVAESAERVRAAKKRVGSPTSFAGQGEARAATTELSSEYQRLTR